MEEKENKSIFEKEIEKLVIEVLEKYKSKIEKEDVKEIIKEIIPSLDNLISKQIKNHLVFISKVIIDKFEEKKE